MSSYGTLKYVVDPIIQNVQEDNIEDPNSMYTTAIDCTTPLIHTSITRRRIIFETSRRGHEAVYNWKVFLLVILFLSGVTIGGYLLMHDYNEWPENFPFLLIDLNDWYTGDAINEQKLNHPISTIIVSHTQTKCCTSFNGCVSIIQDLINHNLLNVPYNFLISSDAEVYEVRGWKVKNGFTLQNSIAVGFIGNFTHNDLTADQINVLKSLIAFGCKRKYISKNYRIYGARQNVEDGKNLFKKISQINQWRGFIAS